MTQRWPNISQIHTVENKYIKIFIKSWTLLELHWISLDPLEPFGIHNECQCCRRFQTRAEICIFFSILSLMLIYLYVIGLPSLLNHFHLTQSLFLRKSLGAWTLRSCFHVISSLYLLLAWKQFGNFRNLVTCQVILHYFEATQLMDNS